MSSSSNKAPVLGKWSRLAEVVAAFPQGADALAESTVIVTGANTGIGKVAAGALAALGGRVVFACRNIQKAEEAVEEAKSRHGEEKVARAVCLELDLSSLQSVKNFAEAFRIRARDENWPPLRCLVLNAGVLLLGGKEVSSEGYELTFAVNHLGHFLLSELLMPELRKAAAADSKGYGSRVCVLSSGSHFGPLTTKDVRSKEALMNEVVKAPEKSFSKVAALNAYGSSKLCNVLFAKALHEREAKAGSGVVACSLHPGNMIATDIMRGSSVVNWIAAKIVACCTKDVEQGASTTMYCSMCPAEVLAGGYFDNCASAEMSSLARGEAGEAAGAALWDLSEELCRPWLPEARL